MAEDCVFCNIVSGEVPCQEVASTDQSLAFRDLDPQAPTHVLVVPKQHVADADALSAGDGELLADMFTTAQTAAGIDGRRPSEGGGGYRMVFNVGDDANNTVPHLHLHVIGGRNLAWPPG